MAALRGWQQPRGSAGESDRLGLSRWRRSGSPDRAPAHPVGGGHSSRRSHGACSSLASGTALRGRQCREAGRLCLLAVVSVVCSAVWVRLKCGRGPPAEAARGGAAVGAAAARAQRDGQLHRAPSWPRLCTADPGPGCRHRRPLLGASTPVRQHRRQCCDRRSQARSTARARAAHVATPLDPRLPSRPQPPPGHWRPRACLITRT